MRFYSICKDTMKRFDSIDKEIDKVKGRLENVDNCLVNV